MGVVVEVAVLEALVLVPHQIIFLEPLVFLSLSLAKRGQIKTEV